MESSTTKIGLFTAIVISLNCMIGAGIFATPIDLAKNAGPASIITMLFVAVVVWFMAMSIARVAQLVNAEGSFYAYAKSWGGHTVGLIAAFSYVMGLMIALGGILGRMEGEFLAPYLPFATPCSIGLAVLIILTILNMLGVVVSRAVQYFIIGLTLIALLSTTAICFLHADFHNIIPFMPHGTWSIFQVVPGCIFGFFGFEAVASLFPILKNPEKNLPKALAYSISIVGLLYIAFIASIMLAVPQNLFSGAAQKLPDLLQQSLSFGLWVVPVVSVAILTAVCGVIHSMIWSSSSLLFSLLKQIKNQKVQSLIQKNIITNTTSVLMVGIMTVLWFLPGFNRGFLFSIVAAAIVLAYLLTMIALWFSPYRKSPITIIGFVATLGIFGISFINLITGILSLF